MQALGVEKTMLSQNPAKGQASNTFRAKKPYYENFLLFLLAVAKFSPAKIYTHW